MEVVSVAVLRFLLNIVEFLEKNKILGSHFFQLQLSEATVLHDSLEQTEAVGLK